MLTFTDFINQFLNSDSNHTTALDPNNNLSILSLQDHSTKELSDESIVETFILSPTFLFDRKYLGSDQAATLNLAYDILTETQERFIDALSGELKDVEFTSLETFRSPAYIWKTQENTLTAVITDDYIIISLVQSGCF